MERHTDLVKLNEALNIAQQYYETIVSCDKETFDNKEKFNEWREKTEPLNGRFISMYNAIRPELESVLEKSELPEEAELAWWHIRKEVCRKSGEDLSEKHLSVKVYKIIKGIERLRDRNETPISQARQSGKVSFNTIERIVNLLGSLANILRSW